MKRLLLVLKEGRLHRVVSRICKFFAEIDEVRIVAGVAFWFSGEICERFCACTFWWPRNEFFPCHCHRYLVSTNLIKNNNTQTLKTKKQCSEMALHQQKFIFTANKITILTVAEYMLIMKNFYELTRLQGYK